MNFKISILLTPFLLIFSLNAIGTGNMVFSGLLIEPPPCIVNNGTVIDIPFNEISVDSVDGVNHIQQVPYTLSCIPDSKWDLKLTLSGPKATFDSGTLQTNVDALGIKVYINSEVFELDTPIVVDAANLPRIDAVPIRRPGSTLTEQAFSVSATLQAEYQ
ncbi:fimbrial protein [Proteus sp. G2665]|uniref:Fimbrial protein n=2 Tax=Morganellaceae TaxID=1903414 RepID=A0ABS0VZE1_9GAMM|nr:hypothetical protein PROPEN_04086 [Proteus penneri ATCC 35198]MBJ2116426.1 fimbrial protein [Proteus penneri]NBM13187.1 fimbrial protein [Proteus sp. G2670]NBM34356.1 fimbrial protein [Proteus sp. G2664]NBM87963.1 fimbrial protein [Proteus sp. G2661]NBN03801.1 fimbrial protein [Proteus sp. G2665]